MNEDYQYKKFNERMRSKNNRQQFRHLIDSLNHFIHNEKLNTNRCLSMITSTFQLQKYVAMSEVNGLLEKQQSIEDDVDVVTVDIEESPGGSQLLKLRDSVKFNESRFLCEKFPIDLILNIWNLTGIGFDEQGKIIYTSSNLIAKLGLTEPIVGEHLSILTPNAKDIVNKIFKHNVMRWVGYIDIHKSSGNDIVSILCNGKILVDADGHRMYLGYLEMKDTMYYNPGGIFWNKEVLISSDFKMLNRHFYIDQLLGYEEYGSDSFEHLHPQDILSLQTLDKDLQRRGYAEKIFRLLCYSATEEVKWLMVLTKMYPFVAQNGELVLVTYSWPFATSPNASDDFMTSKGVTDELEFIRNNEAWLSLAPSFYMGQPGGSHGSQT